jgi:hypothetical protein
LVFFIVSESFVSVNIAFRLFPLRNALTYTLDFHIMISHWMNKVSKDRIDMTAVKFKIIST